jgi:hypothetical protein
MKILFMFEDEPTFRGAGGQKSEKGGQGQKIQDFINFDHTNIQKV